MKDKYRKAAIVAATILGLAALFYLGGLIGQLLTNYSIWMDSGGLGGQNTMRPVNFNPLFCFPQAFTLNGMKGILFILVVGAAIFAYVKFHDKFGSKTMMNEVSRW